MKITNLMLNNCICDCPCLFCEGSNYFKQKKSYNNYLKTIDFKKEMKNIKKTLLSAYKNNFNNLAKNSEWTSFPPFSLEITSHKSKNNFNILKIEGKEPLNYPYIFEIIEYAKKIGFNRIEMDTLGLGLSNLSKVKKLKEAGITDVNFPIYSTKKNIHNKIVLNDNAFDKIFQAIKNLKIAKIKFITHSVILKQNIHEIENLVNKFNIGYLIFPYYFSNDLAKYKDVCPKISDIPKSVRHLVQLNIPCFYKNKAFKKNNRKEILFSSLVPVEKTRTGRFIAKKHKKCNKCIYNKQCDRPKKEYTELYGWNDFNPILNTPQNL